MIKRILWMLLLLIPASALLRAADEPENSVNQPVEVTFRHVIAGGKLKVEYSILNRSSNPIFVFDGMTKRPSGAIDVNWVYTDIQGGTAMLKRALAPTPENSLMAFPQAPLARELAPGARAAGTFRIELPLKQSEPYGSRKKAFQTVEIEKLVMAVGWCPKSAMEEEQGETPAEIFGADKYWTFDFHNVDLAQKIAKAAPVAVKFRARAYSKR